jgi:hypothetical protein
MSVVAPTSANLWLSFRPCRFHARTIQLRVALRARTVVTGPDTTRAFRTFVDDRLNAVRKSLPGVAWLTDATHLAAAVWDFDKVVADLLTTIMRKPAFLVFPPEAALLLASQGISQLFGLNYRAITLRFCRRIPLQHKSGYRAQKGHDRQRG